MEIFNKQTYNSERLIFTNDFKSLDEAIAQMNAFNYGPIKKTEFGGQGLTLSDKPSRNDKNDLYFESENEDGFYYYTIEIHDKSFKLYINRTYKDKMITAATIGDLEMFIENFTNTNKMKEFSLSTAISKGHWNIVKYLIDNYDLQKRPLWDAIRYNKVEIVNNLLDMGQKLPKDWLAYCIYSDSFDVAKELLIERKAHLDFPTNELKTNWYQREINKKSRTSEFIKEIVK